MGIYIESGDDIVLELGRKMKQYFILDKERKQDRVLVDQITVRQVSLPEELQRLGAFTRLVQVLMEEGKRAVQLESVQPEWMKKRLESSPLWIRQSPDETLDFCPSYVRQVYSEPFKLF